ncbi:class I glutamine amidotransferase-like protein [Flammula alnicola]|nr:class I glutamine amidotransferase-like protein [Flammula alnicola]
MNMKGICFFARILIYSATKGFRHDSIPTAIAALKAKEDSINATFDNTEDPSQFTDTILSNYDALVFLSTTGEVLDTAGKAAFQNYLNLGGTFVGIHSSSDTLRNTTFYTRELGSLFDYHANLQNFTVDVLDLSNPITSKLPAIWNVQDEAYNFESDPRDLGATVILAANESSYVDTGIRRFNQGTPHPLAWFQEHGAGVANGGVAGRSFYTSLGHLNETWQDDLFMSHIFGGISWVLLGNTTRAYNSSGLVGNLQTTDTVPSASRSVSPTPSASGLQSPTASS